jgi:uncharacterized membrane protein
MAHIPHAAIQFCRRLEPTAPSPSKRSRREMKITEHELPDVMQEQRKSAVMARDVNADHQSIVVNVPPAELYRRCLRFEELPRFVTSITKVEKINDTCFSCTSVINGDKIASIVEIIMRVPERRIAWQATSDDFRVGVIFFDPLPSGSTRVTVKVRSIVEPILLSGALRDYLGKFKQYVENAAVKKRE